MRRLLVLMIGVLAVAWLAGPPAKAATLTDCLAKNHVCVSSDGRSLISDTQQAQLERDIGRDDIYLVVAASGPSGYNAAMGQIVRVLGAEHKQFVIGFSSSDGSFTPCVKLEFTDATGAGPPAALLTVFGDLKIDGKLTGTYVPPTVSQAALAALLGSFQSGVAAGNPGP